MYTNSMKRTIKSFLPSVSTIGVLLALITISIFQYHWVVSSAATDISELYKGLTTTINDKVIMELSDKPLFKEPMLFNMYSRSDEQILSELQYSQYQFYSSFEDKLSLSIFHVDLSTLEFNQFIGGSWVLEEQEPKEAVKLVRMFDREMPYIYENGIIWQLLSIKDRRDEIIILRIETNGYFIEKFKEYAETILSNYQVDIYEKLPKNGQLIDSEGYKYSPFSRKRWFSKAQLHIVLFPGMALNPPSGGLPRPPDGGLGRPPQDRDKFSPNTLYLDILDDGIPLVNRKENYLTIQWFLNILLLFGIGIGYLFIHLQVKKLQKLRHREKEFIATITHELRTPLTVIQSAADNIESGFLSEERLKQYGKLITDQSNRLGSMIEGILLFSRLEGKAEQPPIITSLVYDDLKISIEAFADSLMATSGNNISINFDGLPVSSITDRETIELILTNLISNSNKHGYDKNLKGDIRVIGSIQTEDSLIFTVEDDGMGIEKTDKKFIFEPFYRGERSHRKQVKGSGLGLFLSYKKAVLLGGKLIVDSHVELGSVFKLIVPYIKD